MKAVVLLSGGVDSSTVLAQALYDGADTVLAVSFRYGSRHMRREIAAASEVAAWFDERVNGVRVIHDIVELPRIFSGGASALMGDIAVPHEEYRNYEAGEGESVTVVPFRNANLISAAVTLAEVQSLDRVYLGMHASDHGTWAYPDCSPEFLGAMANAVNVGTNYRVRLVFPFVWMTKADVVTRGLLFDVPFAITYSCYEGGDIHCGSCPTCNERRLAFGMAGVVDPTEYIDE